MLHVIAPDPLPDPDPDPDPGPDPNPDPNPDPDPGPGPDPNPDPSPSPSPNPKQVLHVIDFDQLKIENQQYLEKIEERNNELLKLKLTTGPPPAPPAPVCSRCPRRRRPPALSAGDRRAGNIVQTLNACKKRLNRLMVESETLKRMIVEKQALAKKARLPPPPACSRGAGPRPGAWGAERVRGCAAGARGD